MVLETLIIAFSSQVTFRIVYLVINPHYVVIDGPQDKFTLHIGQLQQPSPGRQITRHITMADL